MLKDSNEVVGLSIGREDGWEETVQSCGAACERRRLDSDEALLEAGGAAVLGACAPEPQKGCTRGHALGRRLIQKDIYQPRRDPKKATAVWSYYA